MSSSAASASANSPFRGWLRLLLAVGFFCCSHGSACFAVTTYTLTRNFQLQWGTLQKPAAGSQTATMPDFCGCVPSDLTGTGTYLYGTVDNEDDTIKCSGTCGTITIDIQNVSPNCAGVTGIGSFTGRYNGVNLSGPPPWSGLVNPGGGKSFQLGGTATYTSAVVAGSCAPTLDIVVSGTNFTETDAIGFDSALAMTKNSDINFGTVSALKVSTYRISTVGLVSTVSGTGTPLYGTTAAANIQISGSATDGITISAGGYTANNGVTPSNAKCSYNGGAAAACAMTGVAPGAGRTLLVGVDVAADGTQAAGTAAAPTFTITVAYQ